MVKRWAAAGMLNAERSFRRLKGCKDMPTLVAALARHAEGVTPIRDNEEVAHSNSPGRHRTSTRFGTSSPGILLVVTRVDRGPPHGAGASRLAAPATWPG